MFTIIAFARYVMITGDYEYGVAHFDSVVRGLQAASLYIDPVTGLFNSTKTLDWGRIGQGGQGIYVNAVYYASLNLMALIQPKLSNNGSAHALASTWLTQANRIKSSVNSLLYDEKTHMFRDNTTVAGSQIFPQDGNSLAIQFNLTTSNEQAAAISTALAARLSTLR